MIRTNVQVQLGDIATNLEARKRKAQAVLDQQVLKDSNNYAPQDTLELVRSAIRMSRIGEGQIIWDTSYARIN